MKNLIFTLFLLSLSFSVSAEQFSCGGVLDSSEVTIDQVLEFFKPINERISSAGQGYDDDDGYFYSQEKVAKIAVSNRDVLKLLIQISQQAAEYQRIYKNAENIPNYLEQLKKLKLADATGIRQTLHNIDQGILNLNDVLKKEALERFSDLLPTLALGNLSPHYFGPEIYFQLVSQARKAFPDFYDRARNKEQEAQEQNQWVSYRDLEEELQSMVNSSSTEIEVLGALKFNDVTTGLFSKYSPGVHENYKYVVRITIIHPEKGPLYFTVIANVSVSDVKNLPQFGSFGKVYVSDMAYHEYPPSLGSAFHKKERILHPFKKIKLEDDQSADWKVDAVLIEEIVSSHQEAEEALDKSERELIREAAQDVGKIIGGEQVHADQIKLRFFKDNEQVGFNSMVLPLLYERTGLRVYRIELSTGIRGLWQNQIIEIHHNLVKDSFAIEITDKRGPFETGKREAVFE